MAVGHQDRQLAEFRLNAHERAAGGLLRLVMVLLVVGLVTVNAGGTFARLIESHLSVAAAASTSVGERIGVLDVRIAEQARRVAGIEAQDREIADAVAKLTAGGKAKSAIAATEAQQKRRDAIAKARQEAADNQGLFYLNWLMDHRKDFQWLVLEKLVIRWLVVLLVLLIDPSAVVLTIAAYTLDYLVEYSLSDIDDSFIAELVGDSILGAEGARVTVVPAIGRRTVQNPGDALAKIARAYLEDPRDDGPPVTLSERFRGMIDRFEAVGAYDVILVDARAGLHETTAAAMLAVGGEVLLFGLDHPQTFLGYRLLMAHLGRFPASPEDDLRERFRFVHAKASGRPNARTCCH
jgi:hypothetical protein